MRDDPALTRIAGLSRSLTSKANSLAFLSACLSFYSPELVLQYVQRYWIDDSSWKVCHTSLLPRRFSDAYPSFSSGTNGYVVRNLSALRSHQTPADRAAAWDAAPPKHREPDAAILEHERKRKVEVKCLELQLELEEKGYVLLRL